MKLSPWFLAALFAASSLRADGLPDLGEAAQASLSPQMERRIGESIVRDIRLRDPAYLDDAEVTEYLNALGTRLVAASPEPGERFRFFAMRDTTLNAFALPGGYIGVHTGLIMAARSESELAGVLSHEIAHVTQRHIARMLGKQSQAGLVTLAAIVVAILAASSSSDVSSAAMAGAQAAGIQQQLNYSRDFEREADRIGIQILDHAGFDASGMASFFDRLQRFSRLYENNAPAYLRTHPLTTERIADMESRATQIAARRVRDADGFQFVRAKLRAASGAADEAVTEFESQLRSGERYSAAAALYGLARAQLRAKDGAGAQRTVARLRQQPATSPMIDTLEADVLVLLGQRKAAAAVLQKARQRYPSARPLVYAHSEVLLQDGRAAEAGEVVDGALRTDSEDDRLWTLRSRAAAALGKRLQQHRAQAEAYALLGHYAAAVEQLQLAQRAGDGDFYELSAVDARLRELRAKQIEASKEK